MNPFSVFTRKAAFLIRILLCIAAAAALLAWPAAAAQGMAQGVTLCLETLVPSLFPFMVLAEYLSASGLGEAAGKRLHRLSRRLFALPGAAAPVIVLAFLGGYPVGAVGAAGLLRRGLLTRKETRRLMALCCLPSPAFMVCAVGERMLGSAQAGWLLWGCTALAALLPALVRARFSEKENNCESAPAAASPAKSDAFTGAVAAAARSLFLLCAFVALFAAMNALLQQTAFPTFLVRISGLFLPETAAQSLLPVLLEVTGGIASCAQAGAPLWLAAFAAGWGGLCVHGQVFSFLKAGELSRGVFLFDRFLHGVLSAILTGIVLSLFPRTAEVFATCSSASTQYFSSAIPASAALLILCAVYLLCTQSRPTFGPFSRFTAIFHRKSNKHTDFV